jgi:predicted transcriptional regulator
MQVFEVCGACCEGIRSFLSCNWQGHNTVVQSSESVTPVTNEQSPLRNPKLEKLQTKRESIKTEMEELDKRILDMADPTGPKQQKAILRKQLREVTEAIDELNNASFLPPLAQTIRF